MGWSDERPESVQGSTAEDLRALLDKAGERGPFVLVGASRGGLHVRDFLLRYPSDAAGFVFVDSTTEDRLFTVIEGKEVAIAEVTAEQLKTTFPRQPVKVPRRSPQTGAPFDLLPPDLYRIRIGLDDRLIARVPDTVPPEGRGNSSGGGARASREAARHSSERRHPLWKPADRRADARQREERRA